MNPHRLWQRLTCWLDRLWRGKHRRSPRSRIKAARGLGRIECLENRILLAADFGDAPEITSLTVDQAMIFENDSVTLSGTFANSNDPVLYDLVSWWNAEGNADDHHDGNHGLLQNGTTFSAGVSGQAFDFDGTDDYVDLGQDPKWNFLHDGSPFSVSAWLYLRPNPTQDGGILTSVKAHTNQSGFEGLDLRLAGSHVRFRIQDAGASTPKPVDITGDTVLGLESWHHVAVTFDGNDAKIYVDGQLDKTGSKSATPFATGISSANLRIGNINSLSPEPNAPFNGRIDEM